MDTSKTTLPTKSTNPMNEMDMYSNAVQTIKQAILQGQYEAAKGVNRIQLAVYFAIGKYISLHTRKDKWGTHALEFISAQLRRELPGLRGFSETQLKDMRRFYEQWTMLDANSAVTTDELQVVENENITNSAVATAELIDIYHAITIQDMEFPAEDFYKVPFTHHSCILNNAKDSQARYYYIHRVAEEHLSVSQLKQLMKDEAHKHQGDIPNNFVKTINDARSARKAVMMFKDEYLLNFINVEEIGERNQIDVDERVIEQKIIDNIKNFILTFGSDFAFIGNQYHLEAYGVEQFPDLLFFNRELNALVVIELKYGEFKTSYLGQLMGYLRIIDDHVRKPHENPTIGIVLCKSANKEFVEYVIQDYNKPMGVATYKTLDDMPESIRKALPNNEQLQQLLSPDSD